MESLLAFKESNDSEEYNLCPCSEKLRDHLRSFHAALLSHANHPLPSEDDALNEQVKEKTWAEKLIALLLAKDDDKGKDEGDSLPGTCVLIHP